MPSQDPSDDFSQLPTADGAGRQQPRPQPVVRRQQTRIGPHTSPPPKEEAAPGPLSDDWQELLASTDPNQEPAPAEWTLPPVPLDSPAPRSRTVIGRKAPVSEASTGQEEASPSPLEPPEDSNTAESEPDTGPAPPETPRRTVVGKRPAAEEQPPVAPSEPISSDSSPKASIKSPVAKSAPAGLKKTSSKEPAPTASSSIGQNEPAGTAEKKTADSGPLKDSSPPSEDKSSPPASPSETSAPPPLPGPWRERWESWGGKALGLSLAIHLILMIGGGAYVMTQVMEPEVDFLPGGGTRQGEAASQALEHQIQQKKTPWLKKAMPMRKIAAVGSISDIVLPEDVPDLMDLPQSKDLLGGKLTAGMGMAGAGGGIGSGMGLGSKSGMVFQPFSMFGMQIKAKKLALVLDVSTSMAPHLPRVIEEVDKVARGSVVVLYFGCGLEPPPPRGLDGDDVYSTSSVEFEKFWRLGGATLEETRKLRIDSKVPIPSEEIFRILSKRPQTYFIHHVGLGYSWLALLSEKVRTADGLYWFSDFEDRVELSQLNIVRENLERRKQRLYMHAYLRGTSYDLIRTQLVEPTKGDVKVEEQ